MSIPHRLTTLVLFALAMSGCDLAPRRADAMAVDSLTRRPGYIVDSIFTMDEMLRRFRADLGDAPSSLEEGTESRDALVRALVRALAARDTAALDRLRIDRAEFAWIYFPASPFAAAPYELPPEVLWMQLAAESSKGAARAMRAIDPGAAYVRHSCGEGPEARGRNLLWDDCIVHWRSPDGTEEHHGLFGTILEHDGRFKFVSYANGL